MRLVHQWEKGEREPGFQSPIRRDEGCDFEPAYRSSRRRHFQSPIRRDEGCDGTAGPTPER